MARLRATRLLFAILICASASALAAPVVVSVGMNVSDLERSEAFFADVLDFEKVGEREVWGAPYESLEGVFGVRMRAAEMRLGGESIVLTEYLTPRGRPIPPDSRSNDRWFQHVAIVVSDIDAAYLRLRENGVRHVSTAPQTLPEWNPNAGGIRAFYFQDPDGHNLEIIQYPPGKGDSRWQARSDGRLFLGIDHTAIVVASTDASLRFYRDLLGLRVAGESVNHGTEQEHLNLVAGARLRITALRGDGGPGVEFLEYLSPTDGRPAPPDLAANDLAYWRITLRDLEVVETAAKLEERGARIDSGAVVSLPAEEIGFRRGLLARDPDGHGLLFVEP